eukprot:6612315-Pyramimonas_sp.AAC.1
MSLEDGVSLDERSAQMAKVLVKDKRTCRAALSAARDIDVCHRGHMRARRRCATMGLGFDRVRLLLWRL